MTQNLSQTNLALFGSDLEKKIKEASANKEPAWHKINVNEAGIYIWRIEKFNVVPVHKKSYGTFYEGDSYIILKIVKDDDNCDFNIHFWLGTNTSIDEMGTAAYKTVELDNYLHGKATQYREIQSFESSLFRSYFPHGIQYLTGGVESGFRKVIPVNYNNYKPILFMIQNKNVTQIPAIISSLNDTDVFVLDVGLIIYVYYGKQATYSEKYLANCTAEYIQDHRLLSKIVFVEQNTQDYKQFIQLINTEQTTFYMRSNLYKIVDDQTILITEKITPELLDSNDAYVLSTALTTYIWIGKQSTYTELLKAWSTAFKITGPTNHITIVKDGKEPEQFFLHFKENKKID